MWIKNYYGEGINNNGGKCFGQSFKNAKNDINFLHVAIKTCWMDFYKHSSVTINSLITNHVRFNEIQIGNDR